MISPALRQIFVAAGTLLQIVAIGCSIGYSAVLLPALKAQDSPIKIDLETGSWIASINGAIMFPTYLIVALVTHKYGRKITYGVMTIPMIISNILTYFATNASTLISARVLAGISCGGCIGLSLIIIGEYTDPKARGVLLNLKSAAASLGMTLSHIFGMWFDWRTTALLCIVPSAISLIMTCLWPESPSWLASRGRFQESETAFKWLRGNDPKAIEEIRILVQTQKQQLRKKHLSNTDAHLKYRLQSCLRYLVKPNFYKPVLLIFISFCYHEMCGKHTFPAYSIEIITSFTGNKSDAFYYSIIIDIVIIISILMSCILTRIIKRRPLVLVTGSVSIIVLLTICLYLFLKSNGTIVVNQVWIPVGLFMLYFIVLHLGIVPMIPPLIGEVLPLEHRSTGLAITGALKTLVIFVPLKWNPLMISKFGLHGAFSISALIMIMSLAYMYFFMPETKDKTLLEIEVFFNKVKTQYEKCAQNEVQLKIKDGLISE